MVVEPCALIETKKLKEHAKCHEQDFKNRVAKDLFLLMET